MNKNNKAFTLVELLVVILIIGILAAIAVPQYQKSVIKTKYNALKELTKSIAIAQEVYYLANNKYAEKFNQLDINIPSPIEIIDSSPTYDYVYDWGFCRIGSPDSKYAFIKCGDTKITMDYQINLVSGLRICVIKIGDLSSPQSKICREETGKTTPASSNPTWASWEYPN